MSVKKVSSARHCIHPQLTVVVAPAEEGEEAAAGEDGAGDDGDRDGDDGEPGEHDGQLLPRRQRQVIISSASRLCGRCFRPVAGVL